MINNNSSDIDYEDDIFEDDNINESTNKIENQYIRGSGEPVTERPTIDGFFHFNDEIINIQRTMRGWELTGNEWQYTGKPLARDEFINYMINSIRSIVNQSNYLASLEEDEVFFILDEKNVEFIYACYDEPTIDSIDIEKVVNLHDHMLELFLKTVRDGIGNSTVRQMTSNIYKDNENRKKNELINWDALGVDTSGGKRR